MEPLHFLIILIGFALLRALIYGLRGTGEHTLSHAALTTTWVAGLLTGAGVVLLPSYPLVENFTSPYSEPFHSIYAITIYLLPLLAWVLVGVLLSYGLRGLQAQPTAPGGWRAVASLALGSVLLAASFHNLYWLFVWDRTTDSFYVYLLVLPVMAAIIAGMFFARGLAGRRKWYGAGYMLLLWAALFTTFSVATRVNYRELTEARAAQVSHAIERYHAREGRYPADLAQLQRWARPPGPVIMMGQDWCYQAGDDYYRLGYVTREHWSSPYLYIREYRRAGPIPDIPALCAEETRALMERRDYLRVVEE